MEGNKKSLPRALLVFGAPCSGKTTFSESFAKRYGLTFYNLEELQTENNLSRKNTLLILDQVAKTKRNLIIEGCLRTEKEREDIRRILRLAGYATATIWIQTDMATIRMRLKLRHKSVSKARETYDTAVAELEAPSDAEFPIILSGKHTFETQARHVLSALAK